MHPAGPLRKVCLFIGAGGTLGSAFCQRHGVKYAIAAVARQRLPNVPSQHQHYIDPLEPAAEVPENAGAVFSIRADIAAPGQIDRVVELTLAHFGRIDVLVNAAAFSYWAPMLFDDQLEATAERHFLVNVIAPFRAALAVARAFWRDRPDENRAVGRCVINVSSTAGTHVYLDTGQSLYSASKAALNYLTCHMAAEFRSIGVRVAATAPNTFPAIVSTETAADSIDRLIESDVTGRVLVIDRDCEFFTP